jgi:transcriptional regulator NrdR family protein
VSFPCPECGDSTYTKDSRSTAYGVRRRRVCRRCKYRLTTHETIGNDSRDEWTKERRVFNRALLSLKQVVDHYCVTHTDLGDGHVIQGDDSERVNETVPGVPEGHRKG